MPDNGLEVAVRIPKWTVGRIERHNQFTTDVICVPEGGEVVDELPAVHLSQHSDVQLVQVWPEESKRPDASLQGGHGQIEVKMI